MILDFELFENEQKLELKFAENERTVDAEFEEIQTVTQFVGGELYIGNHEVTPSTMDQVLYTAGKVLTENVTVKKIPENYGLVTYNQDRVIAIT